MLFFFSFAFFYLLTVRLRAVSPRPLISENSKMTVADHLAVRNPVSEDARDFLLLIHDAGYFKRSSNTSWHSFVCPNNVAELIIWNVDSISVAKDIKTVNSLTNAVKDLGSFCRVKAKICFNDCVEVKF